MNILITLYSLGIVAMYFTMGASYVFWFFIVSAMVATIPFATSRLFFGAPIIILLWCFIFGSAPYDSTFAWLCIIYTPFYYISWLSIIIELAKSIAGIDD